MKRQDFINDMEWLVNREGARRQKYRRNLRVFYHTFGIGMNNIDDTSVVGYYSNSQYDTEEDTSSGIQENIIKSCIDTLVSKIASQKVRPFFNTVNGTFKEMRIVKQAQQFFDQLYDDQNVNKTVTKAFKDACIFDTGIIYVNPDTHRIERVLPWQVAIDSREASYNGLTRLVWKKENFPVTNIPFTDNKLKRQVVNTQQQVTFYEYWNLNEGKKVYYIPEMDFYKEEAWDKNILPFVFINYDDPVKGNSSVSIVDLLFGIQDEIDSLIVKIKDASQLSSPLKYLVPENSSVKVSKLTNRVGEVITYSALPNQTTPPVVAVTEPFMDPQWISLLDKLKQDAYELCGISQLSATSQKPQGLNSGVALSTMEDIESDRFEVQLNSVIHTYVDIAKACIALFDLNDPILPDNRLRRGFTWSDIVEAQNQLVIQFSAAESLSKDPQTRAQQVLMLVQMGVIPQNRIAALMEIPDTVQGYSIANNSIEAVMNVIDECIEDDNFEVPDFIPTDMLMQEILNTCLSLSSSNQDGRNQEDIDKLTQLYQLCAMKNNEAQTSAEMAAVGSLTNELMADMQNPNGQFNTAIQGAMQSSEQPNAWQNGGNE
jgi:hypothetical protein